MAENFMKKIKIEKLTLNIGAGKSAERLEKGMKLLKYITGVDPVKTFTNKRIPNWGLRPGLPIGCKLTLRKHTAKELLPRLLHAKDNVLKESQFDDHGNIAFGIHEYIDIDGVKYNPEIGILGLEVCITLERAGFRIKRRRIYRHSVPKRHGISKKEAIDFMHNRFKVRIGEVE